MARPADVRTRTRSGPFRSAELDLELMMAGMVDPYYVAWVDAVIERRQAGGVIVTVVPPDPEDPAAELNHLDEP